MKARQQKALNNELRAQTAAVCGSLLFWKDGFVRLKYNEEAIRNCPLDCPRPHDTGGQRERQAGKWQTPTVEPSGHDTQETLVRNVNCCQQVDQLNFSSEVLFHIFESSSASKHVLLLLS